jgi:Autophagy receptor ATG43
MASNPAVELASTIQSASIKRHPSPHHDINPSTAASAKSPATATVHSPSSSLKSVTTSSDRIPSDIIDHVSPRPRRSTLPPLPDLRFEQSYLRSIKDADTWGRVAYITLRDQLMMPLAQGVGWNLAVYGWRYWNRGAKFGGQSLGSKVRRWWWGVNNWELPKTDLPRNTNTTTTTFSSEAEDVRHSPVQAFWKFVGRG